MLERLRQEGDLGRTSAGQALSNPLMVSLARAVYNDGPKDDDPMELLDTDRFPTAAAFAEELRRWLEGLNDEDLGKYKM